MTATPEELPFDDDDVTTSADDERFTERPPQPDLQDDGEDIPIPKDLV